eukprot:257012_1
MSTPCIIQFVVAYASQKKMDLFIQICDTTPRPNNLCNYSNGKTPKLGLVFWSKDECETSPAQRSDLVHPFWQEVSNHLVSLYDPITRETYKPKVRPYGNVLGLKYLMVLSSPIVSIITYIVIYYNHSFYSFNLIIYPANIGQFTADYQILMAENCRIFRKTHTFQYQLIPYPRHNIMISHLRYPSMMVSS